MKLYLVRHGQTEMNARGMFYGWTDCDINEKGIEQAKKLNRFFETIPYDILYCSDLLRAKHTAAILNGDKDCKIIEDERLREQFYGDWEDKENTYVREHYATEIDNWLKSWKNLSIPNGETLAEFYQRTTAVLAEIIEKNKGKTVVIVSHGGTMSAMLCCLTGAGPDAFWRFPSMQGTYSSVLVSGDRVTIERINCEIN